MKAVYTVTIVLSACLLFLVQPLIAKIILPWFGGTSSVWSAALVFFQTCLLGGYGYAHWLTTRVRMPRQGIVHAVLLLAGCAFMPILPADAWRPTAADNPTAQILLLLAATVGLPAILLSATSPLLQVWYMRSTRSEVPYWLFALSNLGSLLALLSFPILLEPAFAARTLALTWSALFIVFAILCITIAWTSRASAEQKDSTVSATPVPTPRIEQMGLWVLLSACASALLVSVSTHLSINVAPIPLLWVVPLALYLLTFILAFGSPRLYHRVKFFPLLALALGVMCCLYTQSIGNWHIRFVIPLYLASLFLICMACHGELVTRRPAAQFLTRYYLLIALGGALGGTFVAVIAPAIFDTYLELPLLLLVIAELNVALQWQRRGSKYTLWLVRLAMIAGVVVLAGYLIEAEIEVRKESLLVRRNFYGVLRVRDDFSSEELAKRHLVHGTISHGYQFLSDTYRNVPGAYYSPNSGIGRVLEALEAQGPIRLGIVGLGAGVLSSYARKDDYLRIYEINPDVASIARQYFDFLPRAEKTGADVQVLLGDARLTLERQPPQNFDVLAIDAFSSDAIPTHLLTNEAFKLYFQHLKPDGVLAVHISNRFLNLGPVCLRGAESVGRRARVLVSLNDGMSDTSVWVLVTSNEQLLHAPNFEGADLRPTHAPSTFPGWTDQYSSLWPVMNLASTSRPWM